MKTDSKIETRCPSCGNIFFAWPYRVKSGKPIYCSKKCAYANAHKRDMAERFWEKVDKNGPIPENRPELGPCWTWTASLFIKTGYGQFNVTSGHPTTAHRVAWELTKGPILEGLHLDHLCRNRACVNPSHTEPVTCQVNILRGETIAANNALKTHCVSGHEFTPENSWYYPDGRGKQCRTCYIQRSRDHRAQMHHA